MQQRERMNMLPRNTCLSWQGRLAALVNLALNTLADGRAEKQPHTEPAACLVLVTANLGTSAPLPFLVWMPWCQAIGPTFTESYGQP